MRIGLWILVFGWMGCSGQRPAEDDPDAPPVDRGWADLAVDAALDACPAETCDGHDTDCDGRIDEGFESRCGPPFAEFDTFEWHRPVVVLTLDFSGSMEDAFGDSTQLEWMIDLVGDFLRRELPIEIGLVTFASEVGEAIAPGADTVDQIHTALVPEAIGLHSNFSVALEATLALLGPRVDGGTVFFVSDGLVTTGGDPFEAANQIRAAGGTILGFEPFFMGDRHRARLRNIVGFDQHLFVGPDATRAAFETIAVQAHCRVGPFGAPDQPVNVYLRDPAEPDDEQLVDVPTAVIERDRQTIRFSGEACARLDAGWTVIVRLAGG